MEDGENFKEIYNPYPIYSNEGLQLVLVGVKVLLLFVLIFERGRIGCSGNQE